LLRAEIAGRWRAALNNGERWRPVYGTNLVGILEGMAA
jgi:hypothetical protein